MKFTDSHEWIALEGDVGTVGITDYAQKEIGNIVYVELPSIGKALTAGEEVAVLESTKAATDIYSPVSGTILEINPSLSEIPELINTSAQAEGWLYKIQLSNTQELEKLMDAKIYQSLLEKNSSEE